MRRLVRPALVVLLNLVLVAGAVVAGTQAPTRQLTYVARVAGNQDIFLLDVDHQLAHNLTHHPGEDSRPVWSPDGRRLAFESWRGGVRAVYVMDADSGQLRRLSADAGASEYAPMWLPDSQTVMFRSYYRPVGGGQATVVAYRAHVDGGQLQRVEAGSALLFQPRERVISQRFVDGAWGLYVTERDATRKLADIDKVFVETPQWSADERLIAFLLQEEASRLEVYLMNADGSGMWQLTSDGAAKSSLSWRP